MSAYKTIRDVAIFTTYRLIIRDAQGLTVKKVEVYSIPYKSINMYSTENAGGMFDINSEGQLFTRAGTIKINLNKKVDVGKIDLLIANAILSKSDENTPTSKHSGRSPSSKWGMNRLRARRVLRHVNCPTLLV